MATATLMCGTYAGYSRHSRNGERPCDPCREARNKYQRVRRRQHPQATDEPQRPVCGTNSGYAAHVYHQSEPCIECRRAHAEYRRRLYRRSRDPVRIKESIIDVLSTQDRWLARDILVSLIGDLHPEWKAESIIRAVYRLAAKQVVDMRIVMSQGQSDRAEYRADMTAWERL